jgi:hypothetical protein
MKELLLLALSASCLHAPIGENCVVRIVSVQQRLFDALGRAENCARWLNPGCLKFARQDGARRGPNGYAVFRTLVDGRRALRRRIARGRGQTVLEFLEGYNPGHVEYPGRVAALGGLELWEAL